MALSLTVFLLFCWAAAASAQAPAVVVSSSQTLVPALLTNTHHMAVNSLGDLFYVDSVNQNVKPANGIYEGYVYELVPGNPTPILLLTYTTTANYAADSLKGMAVDTSNNLYVAKDYYPGEIIVIPYISGSYQANQIESSLSSCPTYPAALTGDCLALSSSGGNATGYYMQPDEVGLDASGNLYVMDGEDNVDTGSRYHRIFMIPANSIETNQPDDVVLIADQLPFGTIGAYQGQMAVDSTGNVYYANGVNVYYFAAGSSVAAGTKPPASSILNVSVTAPAGVGVDAFGNLIITDQSVTTGGVTTGYDRLVEIPNVNGALDTAQQYTLGYLYSGNGVSVDQLGNIYYSSYNPNIPPPGGTTDGATTIDEMNLWSANLGSLAVGKPSAALTLNFTFNAAATATPASISALPAGGSFALAAGGTGACAVGTAQVQGSSCSVTVTYTPSAAGTQSGAVVLADSTGAPIATGYLYGAGLGAAQSVDPGTVTPIVGKWQSPEGIAIDNALNVYVADSAASAVYEYSLAGTLLATIGSGLKGPSSVAVDGAGNVYIADAGNGRVVEVPVVNSTISNASQVVLYSGTSGPAGLSVDAGGNLYIADSGNKKVWRLPNTGGMPDSALAATVGSNFTAPLAVTTDMAGDAFIVDQDTAYEVQAWSGTQQQIITTLNAASGIAIDASGSLYIADTGNGRVIRVPNESGTLDSTGAINVGAGIANPYAVAIDSNGDLYVSDAAGQLVEQIVRTEGYLQFGFFNLGESSGSETATIGNTGNQTLTFGASLYTSAGDTSSFTVSSPSSGGCESSGTLGPGFDCTVSAVFSPTKPGTNQETLTFSSSAVTTSTLVLAGKGANLLPTQLSVAVTSPASGSSVFGQTVTVTATLTATGGFSLGAPTGTVTFSVDGQVQGSSSVSATGIATFMLTGLSGGSHAITASYSGNSDYESCSTLSAATLTVAQVPTASALAITGVATNPLSAATGSSVTLTAIVSPFLTPGPTGTVTFLSGTTVLGSAPVLPVSVGSPPQLNYVAALTTTTLPAGTLNIVASYGGDLNYAASQSGATTLIVSPETFTITPSTANLTVTAGTPGSLTFTVTSVAGFQGGIVATCSGLPANSACAFTFAAGSEGLNGNNPVGEGQELFSGYPQLITVEILSDQVPNHPQPPVGELRMPGKGNSLPVFLALLLLTPLGLARRRLRKKYRGWMLLILLLCGGVGAMTATGCGNTLIGVTPKGQKTVSLVVNGSYASSATTSVTVTQTAQIALTVQ
ncbi:MAG: Ig-like domain repeat protein [Terracidiphilus sp.]|jgi:sugar lactone lactonase YvrE